MAEEEYEDWVAKCIKCSHSYKRIDDDDTIYCRLRKGKCRFEPYKEKGDTTGD